MEHQSGHTYRRGGCKESVQKGRALSVPGGQGSVRQRLPRRITSIKPRMITWNEETCLCIFSLNFALISHLRFCHIFRTCL